MGDSGRDPRQIIGLYQRAWNHADATINELPIDALGHVPWWPSPGVKLFNMMVHVLQDTTRHAGHADILREQLDGAARLRPTNSNLPEQDAEWWAAYRARVEEAARVAAV